MPPVDRRRVPAPAVPETSRAPEAVVVVNARSRRGAALHDRIAPALTERGVRVLDVHVVRDPAAQLPDLLPRVLATDPEMLVLGGGDGTLATVVDHLAGRRTVLGYLPLGTTNNTGRSLGLPLRLGAALDVVAHGRTVGVDLGRANGDWFANLVSVGLSSEVAGRTPHALKRHLGRAAYALTAARALATHRPFEAEVTVDGRVLHVRTHQLNVANGRVHAGTAIAADAGIDDRLLVAYALGGAHPASVLAAAAHQATTPWRPLGHKGHVTGTEIRVVTDRVLRLDVDGELTGTVGPDEPLLVHVDAGALRVRVPQRGLRRGPSAGSR
ncbi:diacylglycerol/lipid kinase family protein [Cellulomonas shaoxiangyii]|uniref:Diacylglycerol kinase n=1 Tax=Cellulomonas shaoxiangyii TaxID=2566013 RepID=A0A4P7SFY1_9CELL|nr:diacylglycerol kinase family protein [Cellulomonas shaoxiangyii]QCB92407.1 diacylglycerol kinase [Cellulomonas shaoxiangyii]TGY85610.1 diacylglycerol kinase [Cellulomonas shaoxiangyii]